MLHALQHQIGAAAMQRITLLANHVVSAEAQATARLRPHAGRCIRLHLDGWPALLPAPPATAFVVTPAGLLEWQEEPPASADLEIRVDMSNPARAALQALVGQRPRTEVSGDAVFAGDVNWLIDNLRWDLEDDLARIVGTAPAREISRIGAAVGDAVRGLVARVMPVKPGDPGASTDAAGPPPR